MTWIASLSYSPSLSSQDVTLVARGDIPLSAVEKADSLDVVEPRSDVDEPPAELVGEFMENAEATAKEYFLCCGVIESPGDGEQNTTVVVAAAAVATAVDQIVLRFICMQARPLEIIIGILVLYDAVKLLSRLPPYSSEVKIGFLVLRSIWIVCAN